MSDLQKILLKIFIVIIIFFIFCSMITPNNLTSEDVNAGIVYINKESTVKFEENGKIIIL